jgi:transcriptional regulator with PAS, ATPase and Fis domain
MSTPHQPPLAEVEAQRRTIDDLQALNRLALKIIAAPNVDAALQEVIAETSRLTNADGASLLLVNPVHGGAEASSSNLFVTLARSAGEKNDAPFRQLSRNVAGWILKNQSTLLSENLAKDERFAGLALLRNAAFGAVGAPIWVAEKIAGTLIVFKAGDLADTAAIAALLQQIAAHVAPALEKLRRLQELAEENLYYRQTMIAQHGFAGVIAKSEAMKNVFALLQRVTPGDARVLIEGDSGTGKELIARTLHFNGPRRDKKFIAVDCGAIPENLLESELFGYVKGAFTGAMQNRKGLFQEADGGTLFLDEINNLPMPLQAKLMRVLQEGEVRPLGSNVAQKVDVRVVAASSRPLAELVKEGKFREELFFRLKVVTLRLPPLRERAGDIPLLASHFLKKFAKQYKKPLAALEPTAMRVLQSYAWPGNIRELEHTIEQAVVLASPEATALTANDLPEEIKQRDNAPIQSLEEMTDLTAAVEALEVRMIKNALAQTRGNKSQAAEKLGLSRRGLLNKLERYKISFEEK